MSSPVFLTLPTELIILVLSQASDPRDLFALIRSSKLLYLCFNTGKANILTGVIQNAFGESTLYDAVKACEASQICKLWAADTTVPLHDLQERFIAEYGNLHDVWAINLRDRGLLPPLFKLWWITDEFVSLFQANAFRHMSVEIPFLDSKQTHLITATERARLLRAFVWYEIFRKVFIDSIPKVWRSISLTEETPRAHLWEKFFQLFSSWEVEQLLSIQEFLASFVEDLATTLQDDIIEQLSNLAEETKGRLEIAQIPIEMANERYVEQFADSVFCGVFEYSEDTVRTVHHLVMRGLPFIRWFLRLPFNDRIRVYGAHAGNPIEHTLFDTVMLIHDELDMEWQMPTWIEGVRQAKLRRPNEGWKWAETHGIISSWENVLARVNLRKVGYVFWDAKRIRNSWRLQTTSPDLIDLRRRNDTDLEAPGYLGEKPMAKFDNLQLPEAMFDHDSNVGEFFEAVSSSLVTDPFPEPFTEAEREAFGFEY